MGVAWGLLTALLWGLADSNAAIASRAIGSFRVVLGFHLLATAALGALAVATGAFDGVAAGDLPRFVWVGALGALSYATFYKALEIGPISIASPIISAYAAVSVVLAVIVIGEALSALQVAAIVVVMLGLLLASSDLREVGRIERRQTVGLLLALFTALAIGGFVFGNAYYAPRFGWLASIFFSRMFTTIFLVAAATAARQWSLPARSPRVLLLVAIVAAVDTGGYVALNLGAERAETSVVSAASAPYALIPIAIGVLFLGERLNRLQWIGVLSVIAGVVLLGLSS